MNRTKIPQLRFKEFTDEWQEKKLDDICDYKNGGSFEDRVVDGGRYKLITLNSIDIDGKIKNEHKTVNQADWFLQKDDMIMVLSDVAHGNFLGLSDIITESNKYVLNQRMGLLRKKVCDVNLNFLQIYINKKQKYFKLHGQGSSQQNLSKGDILKFKIPTPKLEEQSKIASFLTLVDKKINLLEEKKKGFEKYKKGVMQAIFPSCHPELDSGSRNPKIRFKKLDGSTFSDWEEKKLGELVKFCRGNSLSKSDLKADGKYECIHYGELFTEYHEIITSIKSCSDVDTGVNSQVGDILMPTSDVTPQGLAKASAILIANVMLGGDINILRPNPSVNSIMLSYLLNFSKKKIMEIVSGTTVRHIYAKDLAKLKFLVSNSEVEQEKIAEFLTSLDNKVDLINKELEQTKLFKKSLLQRMFV